MPPHPVLLGVRPVLSFFGGGRLKADEDDFDIEAAIDHENLPSGAVVNDENRPQNRPECSGDMAGRMTPPARSISRFFQKARLGAQDDFLPALLLQPQLKN